MEQQISIHDLLCGKTYQEPSAATEAKTLELSCKPSAMSRVTTLMYLDLREGYGNLLGAYWDTVGALPGVCMTLNTGEFPSEERESTLSQILEANVPEKYCLSQMACAGILRRAEARGKTLPSMLQDALMEVVGSDG